jgi:transcriptional regulator with XRE-family HTH domain
MVSGEHASDPARVDVDESNQSDSRTLVRRQLGGAIRRRRHAASLTLATVSERAGISVSMLSQVERGLLDPSLETLRNIADALGTAPFRLLAEEGSVAGVVRRAERRVLEVDAGKLRIELLSPSAEGAFEIAVWELQPGCSRLGSARAHPGEEANLLLQGRAQFEIGDEQIELAVGDCVTFDPRKAHRVTAIGDEPVICVDVVCPPGILG